MLTCFCCWRRCSYCCLRFTANSHPRTGIGAILQPPGAAHLHLHQLQFSAPSFIPEALLFLAHIIGKLCALAAGLDAAAVIRLLLLLRPRRIRRPLGPSAFAVLEPAGIPPDTGLQGAEAGRPQAAHLVAACRKGVRELFGGCLQAGDRRACIKDKINGKPFHKWKKYNNSHFFDENFY